MYKSLFVSPLQLHENLNSDHRKLNIINGSLILTESRIILISSLGIPQADLHMLGKPFLTALISDVISFQSGDDNSSWCFMVYCSCNHFSFAVLTELVSLS